MKKWATPEVFELKAVLTQNTSEETGVDLHAPGFEGPAGFVSMGSCKDCCT